jgi:hypothetical protein
MLHSLPSPSRRRGRRPPYAVRQDVEQHADVLEAAAHVRLRAKRSYNDTALVARQSKQFRQYLELLFADRKPAE